MLPLETLYNLRKLKDIDKKKFLTVFNKLDNKIKEEVASHWYFGTARLNQIIPWHISTRLRVYIPGRGFGKNWLISENGIDLALNEELVDKFTGGKGELRVNLFAESQSDCSDTMILGESGLEPALRRRGYELIAGTKREWPPDGKVIFLMAKDHLQLRFPNKSLLRFYSSTKTRGKQSHVTICDEVFTYYEFEANRATKLERFHQEILTTTRLGPCPSVIYISTPQPVSILKKLVNRSKERGDTVIITGSTYDNPHLSKAYKEELELEFGNTRRGKQELYGIVSWDVPGALWSYDDIKRTTHLPDDITRIVVAVDPAVSDEPDSDETGIVVAAKSNSGNYYIIADRTIKGPPSLWAREAVRAYNDYGCNTLVYEKNQGGLLIKEAFNNVDARVSMKDVWASKGKKSRAEPQAMLYEQGKVYHVGTFEKLEEQMVEYDPETSKRSPDRLDALVWALHALNGSRKASLVWS
jgi:phage terminase large subunit-like protein